MAVSFTYNKPSFWMPRSYVVAFNCVGNLDVLTIDSSGIHMHRALFDVAFFLAFKYDFYPASSNTYLLGTLFDTSTSYATVFGVPASGGVLITVLNDLNRREWIIKVQAYVETSPDHIVTLPPMPSGYWYPYSS